MTQMGYKGSFSANGRGDLMEKPEDVAAMVRLHELGWGLKRIAGEPGVNKNTVKRYVRQGGYSRRIFVRPFAHDRQSAWFDGMEGAFQHFGGVPQQVLLDNPKALIIQHDIETREVAFNERFRHFARYWDFRPVACAPYRARTKGKDD